MSDRLSDLAARKRLLVARSRLHRLELRHGLSVLRASLQPRGLFALAGSASARPALFTLLMTIAGRGRFGRVLRGAMAALTVLKAVRRLIK